jgi:hypothetical protein
MQLAPLAVIEAWHAAINANDFAELCAITATDVELVGARGSSRGHAMLREWLVRAGFIATPLRWFCGQRGQVVVEQRGRWVIPEATSERVVASAFRVVNGRVVRYQRFESLYAALAAASLSDDDEVLS